MSEDSFTETTQLSWFSRIKSAIVGLVFGLSFFLGAFVLLFWNEGRAVKRYKTLKEGESAVVSIAPDLVRRDMNHRLVHMTGYADTKDTLDDSQFFVRDTAIKLKRIVEMYQWKETKKTSTRKKAGGGETTTTTYSYSRVWSSSLIRSSSFKRQSGHSNPTSMPFKSRVVTARTVTLGAYTLSYGLVGKINSYEPVPVEASGRLPAILGQNGRFYNGGYYKGDDPASPVIGDIKVRFEAVYPTTVSMVAQQTGSSFKPYASKVGGTIELLQVGAFSAQEMFKKAHFHNKLLTWGIRLGGLLMMFFGLMMLFKPLSVLADVIPFIGNLIEAGTGLISFIMAVFFSFLTIGTAWVFYRPLLGGCIIALGVVMPGILFFRRSKRTKKIPTKPKAAPARPTSPPPSAKPTAPPPSAPPGPAPETPQMPVAPGPPPEPVSTPMPPGEPAMTAHDWLKKGRESYRAGDLDNALAAFTKAVEIQPDYASAWYNRGVVGNKAGHAADAINDFKKAASLGHEKARKLLSSQGIDW